MKKILIYAALITLVSVSVFARKSYPIRNDIISQTAFGDTMTITLDSVYSKFETTADSFYFNKDVSVDGSILVTGEALELTLGDYSTTTVTKAFVSDSLDLAVRLIGDQSIDGKKTLTDTLTTSNIVVQNILDTDGDKVISITGDSILFGKSTNITDSLDAYSTTVATKQLISDSIATVSGGGTSAYAEIYTHEGTIGQAVANGATYVKLTCFESAIAENTYNMTRSTGSDNLTCTVAGMYCITASYSATPSASCTIYPAVFVQDIEMPNIHGEFRYGSTSDISTVPLEGKVYLNVGDVIDLRMRHSNSSSTTFTPTQCSLNAVLLRAY
jgi:hypothetical protein